jgi:hypothetical protein
MKKSVSFLKKTLKVILYVVLSFVLLFIVIAILIQIPAIQTRLVHYATSFVSNKTHTRVEIKKISISFPKFLLIEGLYLEDTKKDTLLYAGKVKANLAFMDLFKNKIHIRSFALEDVSLHLNRIETDSLFNFNFLITSFSDTTKKEIAEPKEKSKWTFIADNVSMKNIRFHFNDDYGGINVAANLKHVKLKMEKIDLENLTFSIDELLLENSSGSVLIKESATTEDIKEYSENISLIIRANTIEINSTNFSFGDSISKLSLKTSIGHLILNDPSVDLQKELVTLDNLHLSKSQASLHRYDNVPSDTSAEEINPATVQTDWKVAVNSIDLEDNSMAYIVVNQPKLRNTFDVNHLDYKHVTLSATDLYYSFAKMKASIKKLEAVDQNNFPITKFETDFSMDQHSITANNLRARTANSTIDADLSIKFTSLESLADSIQFMIVKADIQNGIVKNSDIVYFVPQLVNQPYFNNAMSITSVSGLITGRLNNLYGKNLQINTGVNTSLYADFNIVGLPDFETAYFNFPNLKITSGKTDIAMFADTIIPTSIELPENISLQIVFEGKLTSFVSTVGMSSTYGSAQIYATIDANENFESDISIANFDLGSLLKNKDMFGSVSLTAETSGHGLDMETIKGSIKADVSQIYLNGYTYHNLTADGEITGREFEGKINLNDENAVFDFDGLVSLNPGREQYKFKFNLQGADLQKLNITEDDIRIGFIATADIKGGSGNIIKGTVGITTITIVRDGKQYVVDSLLFASINETDENELKINSALIGIKYNGNMSPADLPKGLGLFVNNYFPFSDSGQSNKDSELQNFNFEIQIHNHPVLSEVFFPQIKEFEPGIITGSFDSQKNELKLYTAIRKIVYGTTEINDLIIDVNSDAMALNYKISSSSVANTQIKLDNILFDGKLADNTIFAGLSSIDENQHKKLLIRSEIKMNGASYRLVLDPNDFYLMNERWDIATDNYIEFGKQGFLIHHLFINKNETGFNIASVNDQFNDDINIEIKKFNIVDISGIIEKDSGLAKGIIDGNVLLKRVNNSYGLIADATISNLFIRAVPIGDLSVKAENPTTEKFNIDIVLSGGDNNLSASGYFIPNGGDNSINIKGAIQSLSLKTAEAFSFGAITEASGFLTGKFLVEGTTSSPDITGEFTFNDAFIRPAVLNNMLQLKHETVQLKKDGVYFNSFTVLDADLHTAVIDGTVKMTHFKDFIFALHVNTEDFLVFNTTVKDNKNFYGRMIIDSKINISGTRTLPVINAKVKVKDGSTFTFAVPDEKLSVDKGEGIVEFSDPLTLNSILSRGLKTEQQISGLEGFDLSSIVEIDKQATLRLILDPSSSDSLVVKGEAALSFSIDRSGKMSLTGAYSINEGNYQVTLGSLIKRKFDINPGSTIIWNGDLLGAEISINAIFSVRASPIDLIAGQMSEMSEIDRSQYKQRYPFWVLLKLRGEILHPLISFEIQLPPEDKGIIGGAVNAKLNMLNEDPSALNKQVFALLVLGRFIQENPLQSETNQASTIARTSVGKYISAQLNQWSSKLLSVVELNIDIQSYDDYQQGNAEGRTQLDLAVKKQLFNERLTVEVGGSVDIEGPQAKKNSASDMISDVSVEYKLTKDGRFRLKGFRHNQYDGAIEGQLVETGAGVLYVRDFNKWKDLFKSPEKNSEPTKNNSNDPINPE